jgi:hypothetical protein
VSFEPIHFHEEEIVELSILKREGRGEEKGGGEGEGEGEGGGGGEGEEGGKGENN